MKYEMKVDLGKDHEYQLTDIIKSCYFKDNNGKLNNKDNLSIVIKREDPIYLMLRGLNNMTVRIVNDSIIEGSSRFIIEETPGEDIKLSPCNIYCIIENTKYSFY